MSLRGLAAIPRKALLPELNEEDIQRAPRKTMLSSAVKVRPEERLATTSELNLAPGLVTDCGEARGMGYWAATKVKGSSLEMFSVSAAGAVLMAEGSTLIVVSPNHQFWNRTGGSGTWRGDASPTGSETVARYQRDSMVTREARRALLKGVCPTKPINGELVQMALWESDQPIVPEKLG
ncbi:MAG: hypothetical protein EFT35_00255 [Methanophagales archaeon ANME-1-THS]|nr:MAG: hypothetical protein EFT35_00255 [Methanophagales archaeon ANME-1-THS]